MGTRTEPTTAHRPGQQFTATTEALRLWGRHAAGQLQTGADALRRKAGSRRTPVNSSSVEDQEGGGV